MRSGRGGGGVAVTNPYAAGTVYRRFQANFGPNNSTQILKMFCGRC